MWQPTHDFVTQLDASGSGRNDCWEAAYAYYLLSANKAGGNTDPWGLIDEISRVARGAPDGPDNGDTTLSGAERSLARWGIPVNWTASYQAALNAPWSILLVDGTALRPAQYPASWFGNTAGDGNHFVTWMPIWRGATNWFNDPLAPSKAYSQYDLNSVAGAFYGAFLLPSTGHGESDPQRFTALRPFGLLPQPRHGATSLAVVPAGGTGLFELGSADVAGETWQRIQWRGYHGWAPRAYLGGARP